MLLVTTEDPVSNIQGTKESDLLYKKRCPKESEHFN